MAHEWNNAPHKEGFVTINTGRILLTAVGPLRRVGDVGVVCEAGAGSPGTSWCAVARLLSPDVRVYYYHRAGLGRSDASPAARTAENMAAELQQVLAAAHIPPPYVLVAHSYGGIIAREFVAAVPHGDVKGLVLVDTNQESTLFTQQMPFAAMQALLAGFDYAEAIGLWTQNGFTAEELEQVKNDDLIKSPGAPGEMAEFQSSAAALKGKSQFDRQRAEAVAKAKGNGTPAHWEEWAAFISRFESNDISLQREQMKLSSNSRFVQANDSGHHVQITEPELVAEEVLRVVRQVRSGAA